MSPQGRPISLRHDSITIALHWTVAALVLFQWIGGRTIDWFPKGPLKIDARSAHIVAGAFLTLIVVFRLHWKASLAAPLPRPQGERFGPVVAAMHGVLLLMLVGIVGLGLVLEGLRGDSLFNVTRLPAIGSDPAMRHLLANQVTAWHGLAANLILVLAGLHAAAALFHHVVLKDGVLRRML